MPFVAIQLQEPTYATPEVKAECGLWTPKGAKIQWGSFTLDSGESGVGLGIGNYVDGPDSQAVAQRYVSGELEHEDMMMLWFNRTQTNDIIKALRRARVAVYGQDE